MSLLARFVSAVETSETGGSCNFGVDVALRVCVFGCWMHERRMSSARAAFKKHGSNYMRCACAQ